MGIMSGTKQTYKTETESRFSMATSFGYLGMIGYRNKKWGALAGVDFKWQTSTIGGVTMPNLDGDLLYFSRPLVLRGEYNLSKENNRRLIATFWYDGGNTTTRAPYQSIRVELGLGESERWWLLLQYNHQKALGENHFMINPPAEVSFNQFIVGLRIGQLP